MRLFHVSDDPTIDIFTPRPTTTTGREGDAVVWAIEETHLPNYFLPRDCPRVCFWPDEQTTFADRERFFASTDAERVIAVESRWYQQISETTLYLYELPSDGFELQDANARYWVARRSVRPRSVTPITGLFKALLDDGRVELRFMPTLWPLYDAVAASTLGFSIIRMRNAQPRHELAIS